MSGIGDMNAWQLAAIALVAVGVVALGITEATEDDELRAARQQASNHKYAKSLLALLLPIAYCILDAAGTFADSLVLETLNEDSANVAYELTFLVAGLVCGAYVLFVKREKLTPRTEAPKYIGAVCETIGQFFYIYALADSAHVAMSALIILLLLRRLRALEPHFPQGEAERQALHLHPDGVHRHRHHGRIRYVIPFFQRASFSGAFFGFAHESENFFKIMGTFFPVQTSIRCPPPNDNRPKGESHMKKLLALLTLAALLMAAFVCPTLRRA